MHRLIQNRADGKLVELPPSATAGMSADGDGKGPSKKDAMSAEKMEAIGMESAFPAFILSLYRS